MYPIAWSVVEVESKSSWDWFLELLKLDLDIGNGYGWCFSSDQQKGKATVTNLFWCKCLLLCSNKHTVVFNLLLLQLH
ncbi:hypothetical protein LINPERHAP2_LOCUS34585 [Linum perenne]